MNTFDRPTQPNFVYRHRDPTRYFSAHFEPREKLAILEAAATFSSLPDLGPSFKGARFAFLSLNPWSWLPPHIWEAWEFNGTRWEYRDIPLEKLDAWVKEKA